MHCMRWAVWCPFLEASELGDEQAETQLPLLGGPRPNPFEVMVYRATPPSLTPSPDSATAPGDTLVAGGDDDATFGFMPRRTMKIIDGDAVLFCCVFLTHILYILYNK